MSKPRVIEHIHEIRQAVADVRASGKTIGFVPTMGFLHKGHLSLVRKSVTDNDITVVSIYVNPAQFAPGEDLSNYPRDLSNDLRLLAEEGIDYLFIPNNTEMYPDGFNSSVSVGNITERLCGESRPDHFRGVTTIVLKLLNIVQPENLYLGEKDFQQYLVINTMVTDFNLPVEVVSCPLVRESDGLAMSSRNKYLSADERKRALSLYQALKIVKSAFGQGETNPEVLRLLARQHILTFRGEPDYIEIADEDKLQPVQTVTSGNRLFLAVRFGNTRLIDNIRL
ncbi:MAG: pantoate--beta-alanine ligase [Candidatus Cloacimonetes bacterium]|nr:pantoate--beta-alanine ligase [Candidatus Cloacimonadota bacterium]